MQNKSIYIGKVVEISNLSVTIMVDKKIKSPIHIEDGEITLLSGVGNILKIQNNIYEIINEKVNLDDSNHSINFDGNRIINGKLIGYFDDEKFILGNSGRLPNILDNAYTLKDNELNYVYTNTSSNKSIQIGKYVNNYSQTFSIDINAFFGSHILIVGNTGSGKSNTVNSIYSHLFENTKDTTNSKFLIIDTNGEYADAFSNDKIIKKLTTNNNEINEITIPIELVNQEDWKLLLEATDKTQYPIIRNVCRFLKKNIFSSTQSIHDAVLEFFKKSIGTICVSSGSSISRLQSIKQIAEDLNYLNGDLFYSELATALNSIMPNYHINNNRIVMVNDSNFSDASQSLKSEIDTITLTSTKTEFGIEDFGFLLNLEHNARIFKYNLIEANAAPMIARFNSHKNDYSKIFTPFNSSSNNFLNQLFTDKNILICDVSRTNKNIRRIMVTFLCSKMYTYKLQNNNVDSLHLIVDEAHNYLSDQKLDKEDAIAKSCIETFESIIKEGRKFGVYLTMSTQRPSDISATLLSQAHNYVIHKLINPRDIEIIKNAVSYIDERSISMLSVLAPGQAIFSGTAFNRPSLISVDMPQNTKVNSDNIDLYSKWNV